MHSIKIKLKKLGVDSFGIISILIVIKEQPERYGSAGS
jgi:hypothetical protein